MKLSRREIILLVFLLAIVAIGGYYRFLMAPLLDNLAKEKEVLQENKDELQTLKAKKASLPKLIKEVEKLEADNEEFMKILPSYISLAEIIVELDELNKAAGGDINNLSFVIGTASTDYSILAMPVTWTGTYNQLMAFVDSLEQSKRKLVVDSITINTGNAETGTSLQASFTIAAFASATGEGDVYKNPGKTIDYTDIKVNVFSYSQGELFNLATGSSEHYAMIKDIINKYLSDNN